MARTNARASRISRASGSSDHATQPGANFESHGEAATRARDCQVEWRRTVDTRRRLDDDSRAKSKYGRTADLAGRLQCPRVAFRDRSRYRPHNLRRWWNLFPI